jgi:hypothetical protein
MLVFGSVILCIEQMGMVTPTAQFSQVNGQSVPMHVLYIGHFELFMKKTTVLQPCGFTLLYDTIPITICTLLLLLCIVKSNTK